MSQPPAISDLQMSMGMRPSDCCRPPMVTAEELGEYKKQGEQANRIGPRELRCVKGMNPVIPFPGGSDGKAVKPTTRETRVQSLGWDLLEKETATHSSILAWKIPWMEEPGRLQSMGSQRVRHD